MAMKKLIILLATFGTFCIHAQTEKDKKFVACIAKDGLMEIKLAELAQSHASSPEVKAFAQHMIDDHTKAANELKMLADRKNMMFPTSLDDKQQQMYNKMEKLQGNDFDKHYMKCMKKAHNKAICKFKKEAKKGDDIDLKGWAEKTVPTLEHHKQMAKETCKAISKM